MLRPTFPEVILMIKDNTTERTAMYETSDYRCLVYSKRVTDDIYLKLCGLERCMPDYCFYTEGRPGYHLHIILEGKGTLCVNGVEQKLHFGQMFVTKPGEDSWYRADSEDPWTYCWMAFDGNIAKESIEKAGFFENVNVLECNIDQQRFYSLVQRLLNNAELKTSAVYYNTGRLLEFIGLAVESYIESEKKIHKSRDYQADSYVEYAVNFIRNNYATATISAVAKNIGIHRSYLTTIFKKKTGVSPQEFLLQCRLRRACKLLAETGNPIQEIARNIGYDNPLTFSKIFKSYYGISPREYRHQQQSEQKGE